MDTRNYERHERHAVGNFDAPMLLEHFTDLQEQNPEFFYKYVVDEDNKLTHMFWVDEIGRDDYKCFGDVVVFDTTYNTNQ